MRDESAEHRTRFIERFADHWASSGASRIEGRIAGYLLLDDSEGVSAAELAEQLAISAGSVSTYTRRLVEAGFVRRSRTPGGRSHRFVMDTDVWAGFLAAEQDYLRNQRQLAESTLPFVESGGRTWERLRNMQDYMQWLIDARLPAKWARVKEQRDARSE